MSEFQKKSDYSYRLPEELIARYPLETRSASRLLHLGAGTGTLTDRRFVDLVDLLDPGDLLVFNNTRVIPARLYGRKPTGGQVEVLIERVQSPNRVLAHVRASKSPAAGGCIELDGGYGCSVIRREGSLFVLEFPPETPVDTVLEEVGHVPLPPYMEREDQAEDRDRYQTVFATRPGAVAAPTAGLHFDQPLLQRLGDKRISIAYVTLHVGSGTFQPVRVENLADHVMHQEYFEVDTQTAEQVRRTRAAGGRIVAVGTTSVRVLESASAAHGLEPGAGDTGLFILPGHEFCCVDAIVTNFHLPESTLLCLVCAFGGYHQVMDAYRHAVEQRYRFFSYGDAMYIGR